MPLQSHERSRHEVPTQNTDAEAPGGDPDSLARGRALPSRVPGWLGGRRRDALPARSTVRGTGREEDLHHPAHQRHALELHRHGSGRGLHAVHAQRRHDPRRVRAPRRADRQQEGSAQGSGPRAGARRRRLQHGDRRSPPPPARSAASCSSWRRMGYDATTFGNHETDLGPDGLGKAISVAAKAGRVPAVLASNTNLSKDDATLADLQRLAKEGVIRRHLVIERGGIRFGLFGVLGKEAQIYTSGGAVTFADPIETAKEMVKVLRETEKVDVVIALSHGGVLKGKDGRFTDGEDVRAGRGRAGHRRGDRRPQPHRAAGGDHRQRPHARGPDREGGTEPRRAGDLAGRRHADGRVLPAPPGRRHHRRRPRHRRRDRDSSRRRSPGPSSRRAATASTSRWRSRRGTCPTPSPTSPPARSWPISSPTPSEGATKADIGFTANGMMRAGLTRGKSGVQTVYDVFAVAPLGAGVVDTARPAAPS